MRIQSLIIMFFALLAFFTLVELKFKNRKKIKDLKGFKLLCPLCDSLVVEIYFPSETLDIYYLHSGFQRIMRSRRKLGEGEYRIECPKCKRELSFLAETIREKMKRWDEKDDL